MRESTTFQALQIARGTIVPRFRAAGLHDDATVVELVAQRIEASLRPKGGHQLNAVKNIEAWDHCVTGLCARHVL